ncbi:MAG: DUF488 domain-containing protein [Acidobacteriota bacterium]
MGTQETRDRRQARPVVCTVGHSDRSAEELDALLEAAGITHVVDVRSAPWSRRFPWHGKDELERRVRRSGREYLWLGAALGGLRPEGYTAHQASDLYRRGLDQVIALARLGRPALLCAERDPAHCHRRFIADDLVRAGIVVRHLVDPGHELFHQIPLL